MGLFVVVFLSGFVNIFGYDSLNFSLGVIRRFYSVCGCFIFWLFDLQSAVELWRLRSQEPASAPALPARQRPGAGGYTGPHSCLGHVASD